MDFKIQRFQPGHPFYTLATTVHEGKEYQSVFGQCVKNEGEFMHYTLERKETLIEEGVYEFKLFHSNANKCIVPLLINFEGRNISGRVLEHHIANFAYELKGCCAHGKNIDLKNCMLTQSGIAFHELMFAIGEKGGTFTYEKLI